jgi:DNA ligase (NAD+)
MSLRLPSIRPRLRPLSSFSSSSTSSSSTSTSTTSTTPPAKTLTISRIATKASTPKETEPKIRPINLIISQFIAAKDQLGYAATLPVDELSELVIALSDAYYNNDPIVEDRLFDDIQEVLKLIDPTNKALKMVGSAIPDISNTSEPSEGSEISERSDSGGPGFQRFKVEDYPQILARGRSFNNPFYRTKVQLPFLMPSMDKIKTNDVGDYANWLGKTRNAGQNYNISDKVDGMSVALTYTVKPDNTIDIKLYSRGDGQIGEELSALIPYLNLPPVPETLIRANNHLFLRGEVILNKETFQNNLARGNQQMALRNIARGIMGRKTLNTAFLQLLDLVIYELVSPWNANSITQSLNLLSNLGYNVVWNKLVTPAPTLEELQQLLIERKRESPYEIDGLIISQDKVPVRDIKPGDKFPTYAIAFKFGSDTDEIESAITVVRFVTWNKSKDGVLNPVATIRPVGLGGTKVENVTVHNARHVVDMGIGPGAIIRVTRGGDVIPHISASLRPVEPQMPDIPYEWNATEKAISILNPEEDMDVFVKRIEYFFSKLKVPGWGPATVQKIVKKNWPAPTGVHEILNMDVEDFAEIPGFQGKMAGKLYQSLRDKLSNINLASLMAASNIFGAGWGEQRFQTILEAIPDLLEQPFTTEEDRRVLLQKVMAVQGFHEKTGRPLVDNLAPFIAFLYGIYRLGWIGIYRAVPYPQPYIRASLNNKHRIDDDLDAFWDDLMAAAHSNQEYESDEYEKSTILQQAMFEKVHEDLAAYEKELRQIAKAEQLAVAAATAATAQTSQMQPGVVTRKTRIPIRRPVAVVSSQTRTPVTTVMQQKPVKPSLLGKTIVFTGVHAGVEDKAKMLGAKVTGSVSGNTDILIVKDAAFTSSKVTKARDLGKQIMTLDEFTNTYL